MAELKHKELKNASFVRYTLKRTLERTKSAFKRIGKIAVEGLFVATVGCGVAQMSPSVVASLGYIPVSSEKNKQEIKNETPTDQKSDKTRKDETSEKEKNKQDSADPKNDKSNEKKEKKQEIKNETQDPTKLEFPPPSYDEVQLRYEDVKEGVELAKKYEIEIPEMFCGERWGWSYTVHYSKYNQNFTMIIDIGGGLTLYNKIIPLNVLRNAPTTAHVFELMGDGKSDVSIGPFTDCVGYTVDNEVQGHKRMTVLEVPYEVERNGKKEQKSLIVTAAYGYASIIAEDKSSGKWKKVPLFHYSSKDLLKDPEKDKPTLSTILEKDKNGEDVLTVVIVDPQLTKGKGTSYWLAGDGIGGQGGVPVKIVPSKNVADVSKVNK